jgi:hypothetical protein
MPLERNPFFRNVRWRRLVRLFRYFRPDLRRVRGELLLALLCTFGTILAVLARPWPVKIIFDYALIPHHRAGWALPFDLARGYGATGVATISCVLLLAIALIWGLFSYQQTYLISSAGQRLTFGVRRRLAHRRGLSSFHTAHHTETSCRAPTGATCCARCCGQRLIISPTLRSSSPWLYVLIDWQLTTVSLAVLPLMTVTAFRFSFGRAGGAAQPSATAGWPAARCCT